VRAERFLGSDPTPGDLAEADDLLRGLREVVLLLVEARGDLEPQLAADGVWTGPAATPLAEALGVLTTRLRALEDVAVDLARATEDWRRGFAARTDRTDELVEQMSRLAGRPDAQEGRDVVHRATEALAAEHDAAARRLRLAVEQAVVPLADHEPSDLAADLAGAGAALAGAVDAWVEQHAGEVAVAAAVLAEVSRLTRVVGALTGVVGDRDDVLDDEVTALARSGVGSHRLLGALRHVRAGAPARPLPRATFAGAGASGGPDLAERMHGRDHGTR